MNIQLIDVDGHNFPNLPLMKLSAWHKAQGDIVEWYNPLTAWIDTPDRVYMSKIFTFTQDYPHPVSLRISQQYLASRVGGISFCVISFHMLVLFPL